MQQWRSQGLNIHWLTLLLDNPDNSSPPTIESPQTWKENFGLTLSAVAADPNFGMVSGGSVGTPQFTIINPRTMEVLHVGPPNDGMAEQLAMDNAAQ